MVCVPCVYPATNIGSREERERCQEGVNVSTSILTTAAEWAQHDVGPGFALPCFDQRIGFTDNKLGSAGLRAPHATSNGSNIRGRSRNSQQNI